MAGTDTKANRLHANRTFTKTAKIYPIISRAAVVKLTICVDGADPNLSNMSNEAGSLNTVIIDTKHEKQIDLSGMLLIKEIYINIYKSFLCTTLMCLRN